MEKEIGKKVDEIFEIKVHSYGSWYRKFLFAEEMEILINNQKIQRKEFKIRKLELRKVKIIDFINDGTYLYAMTLENGKTYSVSNPNYHNDIQDYRFIEDKRNAYATIPFINGEIIADEERYWGNRLIEQKWLKNPKHERVNKLVIPWVKLEISLKMWKEAQPPPITFSGMDGCFIATAAYGTSMCNELDILRNFRDTVLAKNIIGRFLVKTYYMTSPPIADFISHFNILRWIIRQFLKPIIFVLKKYSEWR